MSITYRFKDGRDRNGNGYSGYIEDGMLVLEYDDPRSGGCYYRGSYEGATKHLDSLKREDIRLYNAIEKYYTKHGIPDTDPVYRFCSPEEGLNLRFIGTDGSMGLERFKVYLVKVYSSRGFIWVEWSKGKKCPYTSPMALASNWIAT
jgi:hypothetical protein